MPTHAIIVGAGKSTRMQSSESKIFLPLLVQPLVYHTIKIFENCSLIDSIILVVQNNDIEKMKKMIEQYNFKKITAVVEGGQERQDSVYNGLMSIKNARETDVIVVHNASNPLVKEEEIINCINDAKQYGAAVCAFPLKDTIKKVNDDFVESTVDRSNIWQMQTPQAIKCGNFVEAFENAKKKKLKFTDDVALVESIGKKVKITKCSYENIKITTPDDLVIAEGILRNQTQKNILRMTFSDFKMGIGQDSHKFSKDNNKKLILGGFIVPNENGMEANSDGDIILHALFNAISTAIGETSLGFYADEMCKKGITDSKEYLEVMLEKMKKKSLEINNASISIEAKKPKLEQYNDAIKEPLSKILKIEKGKIGIAFTSGEGLTDFGKGDGMQCFVIVSLIGFN